MIKRLVMQKIIILLLLPLAILLTSCSPGDEQTESTVAAIRMQNTTFTEWEKTLTSYQPNIVVVDAWAMWCTSCIKRFPHMVEMANKYQNKGVQFVSLNLDDRNDEESVAAAKEFLVKMNANFDHFHMNEDLIEAFDRFNLIGIPAVFIYDGTGAERFRLTGDNPNAQFTEKDIESAVESLLSEKSA